MHEACTLECLLLPAKLAPPGRDWAVSHVSCERYVDVLKHRGGERINVNVQQRPVQQAQRMSRQSTCSA